MKTYILSVNTLMRNLTSERHDNCASCPGLILPIRWVMPPPNFLFEVLHSWCYISCVFTFGLASISTCLHDYLHYVDYRYIYIYIYVYICQCSVLYSIHLQLCLLVESFELSECDRTLTSLCSLSQNSISPSHMHSIETVECLLCVLVSRRYRDNH